MTIHNRARQGRQPAAARHAADAAIGSWGCARPIGSESIGHITESADSNAERGSRHD
jgi:hypothetical protein